MEGRRSSKRHSKVVKEEKEEDLVVETSKPTLYNKTVKLQLRISARVIVESDKTKSGKRYVWERAGAIVEVDEEDIPALLPKTLGQKACCGGNDNNLKLFVLVE